MECIFCKIAGGEIKTEKVYENDNFFSIRDIKPKVEGHSLVISKKHFKTILDVPDSLASELLDCIKKTTIKLMNENKAEGFNLVNNSSKIAGQIVDHFHVHILPRKTRDNFSIGV